MKVLEDFYRLLQPVTTGYPLIRLGSPSDGGYLVPDCLSGIECCVSPGVCENFELEELMANNYGIRSVMCDPSHDPPENLHPLLRFDRVALSSTTNVLEGKISMDDLLGAHDLSDANPLMLSMDIEGVEYEVLPSVNDWSKFRIIVIEFHFFAVFHRSEGLDLLQTFSESLQRILDKFDVVHFRPNNHIPIPVGKYIDPVTNQEKELLAYACIEVTLLNKCMRRHAPRKLWSKNLPHFLDKKNDISRPEVDYALYDYLWNNPRYKSTL